MLYLNYLTLWLEREREYRMGVLGETTSIMALLWCALHFMQDRKSKDYNFTVNSIELGRIL